jgi:hypothetical protein
MASFLGGNAGDKRIKFEEDGRGGDQTTISQRVGGILTLIGEVTPRLSLLHFRSFICTPW